MLKAKTKRRTRAEWSEKISRQHLSLIGPRSIVFESVAKKLLKVLSLSILSMCPCRQKETDKQTASNTRKPKKNVITQHAESYNSVERQRKREREREREKRKYSSSIHHLCKMCKRERESLSFFIHMKVDMDILRVSPSLFNSDE